MLNESSIEIRPVDMTNWADFEAFFESKGKLNNCWCMVWRMTKEELKTNTSVCRKAFIKACGQVFRLVFWLTPMDVRSHGAPSPPERHIKDWAATTI
ncbi:MAG: hypothetical protein ABFD25_09340 [Clostridiaceae bacterium]|jgi:hypothetical protein